MKIFRKLQIEIWLVKKFAPHLFQDPCLPFSDRNSEGSCQGEGYIDAGTTTPRTLHGTDCHQRMGVGVERMLFSCRVAGIFFDLQGNRTSTHSGKAGLIPKEALPYPMATSLLIPLTVALTIILSC